MASSVSVWVYLSIPLNALSAGGIFCFPLFAPSLATHLNLSQGQLSTIVLAGMMGQYPFATLWGMFVDRAGPWACSLSASVLFTTGYSLFAWTIRPRDRNFSQANYYLLVFYFFLAGLGTVASYFSCLFSASKVWKVQTIRRLIFITCSYARKSFPNRSGLATGVVTALFGLSPLFLSSLGSIFFADEKDGLDAPNYLFFLAIFSGSINLLGAVGLRSVPHHSSHSKDSIVESASTVHEDANESTALLRPPSSDVSGSRESLGALLQDADFWLLGFIMLCCMGMSEMVVSNIGTIVASLSPAGSLSDTSASVAGTHVRLISLANTISRLMTGPVADFTSPAPIQGAMDELVSHSKRSVTRVAFVTLSCILLSISFIWMAAGITTWNGVWVLSIGTGAAYGMIWTVVPSLTESIWGSSHVARNFGTLSYAPFIGTPIFTLLYATVSDHARPGSTSDPICRGTSCWRLTFLLCAMVLFVALTMSGVLWRRWGHRV